MIATTRFPHDLAARYGREADADEWRGRLEVHGLDLRDLRGVETFCAFIAERHEALDVLVNNACQTVRRFSCGVLCFAWSPSFFVSASPRWRRVPQSERCTRAVPS